MGESKYYSWPPNAIYYRPPTGGDRRVTRKDMWIAGNPIWIERTKEIVLLGVWHSDLRPSSDPDEASSPTPNVYLISPEKKDWMSASKEEWNASVIFRAEQVSCSE